MTITSLEQSGEVLTLIELLTRTADYKGVSLDPNARDAKSQPIKTYSLDSQWLSILAEQGITRQPRPDCQRTIFTLVDTNPQDHQPGWAPSNFWNFRINEESNQFDPQVTLRVGFVVSLRQRGIILVPRAPGGSVCASDDKPHYRMFKALTDHDPDASPIAKELAASEGTILVSWTALGLGGIRTLAQLFAEFTEGKPTIEELGNSTLFEPAPRPHHQQPKDALFVTEPAQYTILSAWRKQLEHYIATLT